MDEEEKIRRLRELLLEDDRAAFHKVEEELKAINEQINDHDKLVDILYPVIGKVIKKFIALEFKVLTERIDAQFAKAFSWKGWKRRIKGWFGGAKQSDLMVQELSRPELEEMFIIESGSGILLGSYSRNGTVDQDMIAGMLTAIKAFVEDAFSKHGETLEMIEYGSYNILLYEVKSFYVAVVCSGVLTAEFKAKMQSQILDFVEGYLAVRRQEEKTGEGMISKRLKEHFNDFDL